MIKKVFCGILVGIFSLLPLGGVSAQEFTADLQPQVYVKNLVLFNDKVAPGEAIRGSFTLYSIDTRPAIGYSYAVSLLVNTPQGEVEVGSPQRQTFDFAPKESRSVEFSYVAPNASGTATLRVETYTSTGFEVNYVKKDVSISGTGKVLDIPKASVVVGGTNFALENGPTVSGTTSAYVALTLKNTTGNDIELSPNISLYAKSVSAGERVGGYASQKIFLKSGEKKDVKIEIQVPEKPGVYEGLLDLNGGPDILVSQVPFRFIRGGRMATIQSVTTTQSKIEKGSVLVVSVAYTGTPYDILSKKDDVNFPATIRVEAVDRNGALLGKAESSILLGDVGMDDISVPIERDYSGDISAKVSVVDNGDNAVLASGSYLIVSPKFSGTAEQGAEAPGWIQFAKDNWKFGVAALAVIVLAIVLVWAYVKTRNASVATMLAFVVAGSLLGGSYYLTHSAKAGTALTGEQTYISSGIGCSYKDLVISKDKSSYSLQDKYVVPCSAKEAYSLDVCQYVTEKTISGKTVDTLGQISGCSKIALDQSAKTCSVELASGKNSVIDNCVAANRKADSLYFDTSMGCKIDYTDSKGNPKTNNYKNCRTIDFTGGVCTYFYSGKIRTQNNCTGMSDYSAEYDITGVPSAEAQRVSLVNFTAPSGPNAEGKIVLDANTRQDVSGNVYFASCQNSPTSASIYLTMIDPDGHATGYRYKKGWSVAEMGGEGWHSQSRGFSDTFTVPSRSGKYSIIYLINVAAGQNADRSSSHSGKLDFWVNGTNDTTCADCATNPGGAGTTTGGTTGTTSNPASNTLTKDASGILRDANGNAAAPDMNLYICRTSVEDDKCLDNAVQVAKGGEAKLKYDIVNMDCATTNPVLQNALSGNADSAVAVASDIQNTTSYTLNCSPKAGVSGDPISKTVKAVVVGAREF